MYQFTEMFGDLEVKAARKSYRWWGLAAGIFFGWIPAWGMIHWRHWGAWSFAGIWLFSPVAGYFLGKALKKK